VGLSSLPSDIVALDALIPTDNVLTPVLNPNGLVPTQDELIPVLNPLTSQADNALSTLDDNVAAISGRFVRGSN
jgi:hypothetical protein